METVYSSSLLREPDRARAWVDALNSTYVCLDSTPKCIERYDGFLKKVEFGDVSITDTFLSAQTIQRRAEHIAKLDKDCFYFQFLRHGDTEVETLGQTLRANQVTGTLFSASDEYNLHCADNTRSWWLEIERSALVEQGAREADLNPGVFSLGRGVGRLAYDHMLSLASEENLIGDESKALLGRGLIDMLVIALQDPSRETLETEQANVAEVRLRSAQHYIRRHLRKPGLTPAEIAEHNGISLGYLHRLFRTSGKTVSEWLREERLQHSYALLAGSKGNEMTITDIAFASGFSSSSYFSNAFRARYGISPRELKGR